MSGALTWPPSPNVGDTFEDRWIWDGTAWIALGAPGSGVSEPLTLQQLLTANGGLTSRGYTQIDASLPNQELLWCINNAANGTAANFQASGTGSAVTIGNQGAGPGLGVEDGGIQVGQASGTRLAQSINIQGSYQVNGGPIPVSSGGTGANNGANALANLGVTPTPGAWPVLGVTDGSNAATGMIGEVIQWGPTDYAGTSVPDQVPVYLWEASLPPGDWDCSVRIAADTPGTTYHFGFSAGRNPQWSNRDARAHGPTGGPWSSTIVTFGTVRLNTATAQNIYIGLFRSGTATINFTFVTITARRMR